MTSIAQSEHLSKDEVPEHIRAIVKTDDPQVFRMAMVLDQLDDECLAMTKAEARNVLERARAAYEETTREHALVDRLTDVLLLARIIERGARAIPSDDYMIELTASKGIDKRIDVLRRLEGKVPADELKKALYLTQPEPQWQAHATHLKTLARKYGGEVAAIVNEGLVETLGPPRLKFEKREHDKNVTPAEVA